MLIRFLVKTLDVGLYCLSMIIIASSVWASLFQIAYIFQTVCSLLISPLILLWFFRQLFIQSPLKDLTFRWSLLFGLVLIQAFQSVPKSLFPLRKTNQEQSLKLYSQNVHQFENDTLNVQKTINQIIASDADFVCLQEFGLYYQWPNVNAVASDFADKAGFEYFDFTPQKDNIFGTAFFSKTPILKVDMIFQYRSYTNEAKRYWLTMSNETIQIVNVHFQSFNFNANANDYLSPNDVFDLHQTQVSLMFATKDEPDIIIGDFNEFNFGPALNECVKRNYTDVQNDFGQSLSPTFPSLNARLDYCFIKSSRVNIADFQLLSPVGSDHKAILVSFTD